MKVDRRYTFFLNTDDDGLTANLCGGTTSASHGLERQIIRWTGPPAMSTDVAPPAPSPVPDNAKEHSPRQSDAPLWIVATTGGGIAVLAAAGTLLWRRKFGRPAA